jgi:hypothetical protein
MDPETLVEGGLEGLQRIVSVLEANGVPVEGAYVIKLVTEEGQESVIFRIVTNSDLRALIFKVIELKRSGSFPKTSDRLRFDAVRPGSVEASRILGYAARVGTPVVEIHGAGIDGLYVEDAIVVKWPKRKPAVA